MKYKIFLTIALFLFSILYLKNSIYILKNNDFLMQEIKNNQVKYNIEPIDAIITINAMIPGIKGKRINCEKSYNKMKSVNYFKESLIVYDEIKPYKTISNIYNKVIISGNKNIPKVAINIKVKNDLIDKIKEISTINNTNLDINNNIYCFTNKIIITKECQNNHQYTLLTTFIDNHFLSKTKELLKNGILLTYEFNETNYQELNIIIKYIKNNNYTIVPIKELIKE